MLNNRANEKNDKLTEYILLVLVLLVVFGVYLRTAFPAFRGNDSPETAAAAYTLGIQHAPGYPVFTMLGKIAIISGFGNPALKVNLLSAFLAVIILLLAYITLTRHVFSFLNLQGYLLCRLLGFGLILILAFSRVFWSQAIEAKGGIYMLNLLFLSVLILLAFRLFQKFEIKHALLFFYIFGLSLANHWPSMAILAPAFAYVLYRHKKELNGRVLLQAMVFFAAGVSAYLFLYIRAGANPPVNWGNPSSIGRLLDVILRKIYSADSMPLSFFVLGYQLKHFAGFISSNYWILWLLAIPGLYAVHKKQRPAFWLLVYIILVTAAFLIFYFRFRLETIWLMGIFLLPLQYAMFIFIAAGAGFIFAGWQSSFYKKTAVSAVLAVLIAALISLNFRQNDRHEDYLSYDLIHNINASTGSGAYYLPEHDMYLMPMIYENSVQNKKHGLKIFPLPFLIYDWGVLQAQKLFGYFPSKTGDILYNLAGLTGAALENKRGLYRDFSSPAFDALKLPLFHGYAGLVKRVSAVLPDENPGIYGLYSFRGLYRTFAKYDENIEIVTRYLIFISMHAERMMQLLRYRDAVKLFEKALRIPADKLAYNIYFNMARCYAELDENNNAIDYLKKAIEDKSDFLAAYEAAGRLYYEDNDIYNAHKMFSQAVMLGSLDPQIAGLEDVTKITVTQNEAVLAKAGEFAAKKNYKEAIRIYKALIKLEYRPAEVYVRLGQIYYAQGDKDGALAALAASNIKSPNPGAFYYSAVIYREKGLTAGAKAAVLEGLARFKHDKRLLGINAELNKP